MSAYNDVLNEDTGLYQSVFRVDKEQTKGNLIQGRIKSQKDGMFITSIPFDKGFEMTIDGVKVKCEKVNKAYLLFGEQNLGIKADLKIVSAETAHILDGNCADFPGFGFCKHCLKSGTIEVTPCVTVIFQKIVCKKFVILKIHINCNLCYSIEK